jgi:hypothetical protein
MLKNRKMMPTHNSGVPAKLAIDPTVPQGNQIQLEEQRQMDKLPHELESSNNSPKLSEEMMDQNHQHQIPIQHLMYHLTCSATEIGKYRSSLEKESRKAINLLQYY